MLLAALVLVFCFSSSSKAQVTCSTDGTTNPVANSTTATTCLDPNSNSIVDILDQGDFGLGGHATGSSHNQMYQMTDRRTGAVLSTDYILHFSYTDDTWITNIAINQALVGAGFDIAGYTAEWQWKNENTNTINGACTATKVNGDCLDDLVITVEASAGGTTIYSEQWDYSQTKSNGYTVEEVLSFAPLALVPGVTIDQVEVTIRGKDNGYWQGMHGPKVKNLSGGLVIMPDSCTINGALSDPSCPGYVNALFQQQCTQNPLYDPTCPGYKAANLTNQCAANPLYDAACPGYAAAYLADRCYYDPLYDVQCTGYQQAYFDQQCELDGQYDKLCPNYLDPDLVDLGTVDPVEEATSEDVQIGVAELDFTQTQPIVQNVPATEVYVPEVQNEEIEAEETLQAGAALAMEDDIEKEIKQIEAEANEGETVQEDDIEAELAALENETTPGETNGDVGTGETKQEDDIEKEIAALKAESNKPVTKKKTLTKNDKIRMLLAKKANELTKQIENAVTLEQQMITQRSLLALISFVPGFDYNKKDIPQTSFYPEKPTVDHAYARWFLNDPKFGAMEDLQYPKLRSN